MDKEPISSFRFRLYWLFSFICFTLYKTRVAMLQNNLELHWVAIRFGWVILHRYTCVRLGVRSRDYQKFRGWVDYNKTLPSRFQGLDFLIYVSEEERKKLETTLKVTYLSFHCTGPHIPPDLFLYTHTHSFTLFSLYSRKWLLHKVPFRSFSLILLHVLPPRD